MATEKVPNSVLVVYISSLSSYLSGFNVVLNSILEKSSHGTELSLEAEYAGRSKKSKGGGTVRKTT